jgi:predicted transposase YbfD/YdcC
VNAIKEKISEVVAVDGKSLKGSQKGGLRGLHMVSAWGASNKLVLGQEVTQEKSNEITAIPALLKLLELKGCIVTIDAMGCQLNIARQIIKQKADYVLGLKGNQGLLHKDVKKYFKKANDSKFKDFPHSHYKEVEKKHGRHDIHQYWILDAPETLHRAKTWKGLQVLEWCNVEAPLEIKRRLRLAIL